MNDKIKSLYDFLVDEGYEFMGSEDEFREKVQDTAKVNSLHDFLAEEGYEFMGTKEEFLSKLHGKKEEQKKQQEQRRDARMGIYTAGSVLPGSLIGTSGKREEKKAEQPRENEGGSRQPDKAQAEVRDAGQPTAEERKKAEGDISQEKPKETPNDEVQEQPAPLGPEKFAQAMQMQSEMGQMQQEMGQVQADFAKRLENIRKANTPFGSGSEMRYNPQTGEMEKVYLLHNGDEVYTEMEQVQNNSEIDMASNDERRTRKEVENLDARLEEMLEEAKERATEKYVNSEDVQSLTNFKDLPWYRKIGEAVRHMNSSDNIGAFSDAAITKAQFETPEVLEIKAAQRMLRDAKRTIAEADHNAKEGTLGEWLESSFVGGALRGFGQKVTDLDTWDFGFSALADNSVLLEALEAFDRGEELRPSQQALLDAVVIEMAVESYISSVGRGYKAGSVTAESLPFMLEMWINPASGLGSAVSSKMTRYAIKRFGKAAVKKGGSMYVARKSMEIAARGVGDVVGAGTMTLTTGQVRTIADAYDRMSNAKIKGKKMSEDEAYRQAFLASMIENYSEMFGEYFSPLLKGAGKGVGKLADTKVGQWVHLDRAEEYVRNVGKGSSTN